MNLRHLICALSGHRYHETGNVLGSRLERCERCGKMRAVWSFERRPRQLKPAA